MSVLNAVKRIFVSGVTYAGDTNEFVWWSFVDVLFGLYCGVSYISGRASITDVFLAVVFWEVFNVLYLRNHANG